MPECTTAASTVRSSWASRRHAIDRRSTLPRPPLRPLCLVPRTGRAVERIHATQLSPRVFARHQREGTPLLVEGTLGALAREDWGLSGFAAAVGAHLPLTCRIHGGDGYATSPDRWTGRKHMRSTVTTTAPLFADSIRSGIAAANGCGERLFTTSTAVNRFGVVVGGEPSANSVSSQLFPL